MMNAGGERKIGPETGGFVDSILSAG